ncbi:MAG: ribonuclease Z [Desulfurococcaceae archaeon]
MNARIYFLGTGTAVPMKRGLPCIVLKIDSQIHVFDIGEGCQNRMFEIGLSAVKVKSIFISHLHGDHYLGLFGLLQSMNLLDKRDELQIISPGELENIIKSFINEKLLKLHYQLSFICLKDNLEIGNEKFRVKAFRVEHSVESYGFNVVLGNGFKFTYTGDTLPTDRVVEESRGSNILIHEATFIKPDVAEAYEQKHSTAADAAIIASRAGVKKLILTHISPRYKDDSIVFYDAYRFFKNVVIAKDYLTIAI